MDPRPGGPSKEGGWGFLGTLATTTGGPRVQPKSFLPLVFFTIVFVGDLYSTIQSVVVALMLLHPSRGDSAHDEGDGRKRGID